MGGGLLIGGLVVDVPGVDVVGPHEVPWNFLSAGDFVARASDAWVRQFIVHKTEADYPEVIRPGAGPAGGARSTVIAWQAERVKNEYAGAHTVADRDGTIYQLADLQLVETWHATVSNAWSVGHEIREEVDASSYEAAMESTVAIVLATCRALGIQLQMQRRGTYTGHPIARMTNGGPDMVGIFGHRLNTEQRGKWDPGEIVWDMLAAKGVREFDFATREDVAWWMTMQQTLAASKHYLGPVDGIPGPATVRALESAGYPDGIFVAG